MIRTVLLFDKDCRTLLQYIRQHRRKDWNTKKYRVLFLRILYRRKSNLINPFEINTTIMSLMGKTLLKKSKIKELIILNRLMQSQPHKHILVTFKGSSNSSHSVSISTKESQCRRLTLQRFQTPATPQRQTGIQIWALLSPTPRT